MHICRHSDLSVYKEGNQVESGGNGLVTLESKEVLY